MALTGRYRGPSPEVTQYGRDQFRKGRGDGGSRSSTQSRKRCGSSRATSARTAPRSTCRRRGSHHAVRAGDPQPRPMHLLFGAFPHP